MSEHTKETFVREPRYVVFKIKDIERYVTSEDKLLINEVGATIAVGRKSDGKPPFNAVVVEQDWPEFDLIWQMIEARMLGRGNDHRRIVACVNACNGISTEGVEVIAKLGGVAHKMPVTFGLVMQRDELLAALMEVLERMEQPPARNCSCHLSPPCNDCVEFSGIREAIEFAESAIAKVQK